MRYAHEAPTTLDGQKITVTREQIDAAIAQLKPGDELALAREPGNPANSLALMVLGSSIPVGWVTDLLFEDLNTVMKRTNVSVRVAHVNDPDAPWHLRLLVRLRAAQPTDSVSSPASSGHRWRSSRLNIQEGNDPRPGAWHLFHWKMYVS